jgi:hypothetical protein
VADIIAFAVYDARRARPDRAVSAQAEVVVFPRTNIRVLRRLWGLPEYGPLVAGPDGRAVGALGEDGLPR